jgi:hypothetical protein
VEGVGGAAYALRYDDDGPSRARSHCRVVLPLVHFIPDSLTYSVPLYLKRQCDRTLGLTHGAVPAALVRGAAGRSKRKRGAPPETPAAAGSGEQRAHRRRRNRAACL